MAGEIGILMSQTVRIAASMRPSTMAGEISCHYHRGRYRGFNEARAQWPGKWRVHGAAFAEDNICFNEARAQWPGK